MIITLSGVAGSGKSTVAKLVAQKLGLKHFSMGDLQRQYAIKKGLTIEELGKLEATDPTIDQEVDATQTELAKKEDNFVIDSWLGFHFIPQSFKVFLDCEDEVAAGRIYGDTVSNKRNNSEKRAESLEEAIKIRRFRQETNRDRWYRFYQADFLDKNNYNLVVDTSHINIDQVVEKILNNLPQKAQ